MRLAEPVTLLRDALLRKAPRAARGGNFGAVGRPPLRTKSRKCLEAVLPVVRHCPPTLHCRNRSTWNAGFASLHPLVAAAVALQDDRTNGTKRGWQQLAHAAPLDFRCRSVCEVEERERTGRRVARFRIELLMLDLMTQRDLAVGLPAPLPEQPQIDGAAEVRQSRSVSRATSSRADRSRSAQSSRVSCQKRFRPCHKNIQRTLDIEASGVLDEAL